MEWNWSFLELELGLRRSVDAEGRGGMEWLSRFFPFFFFFGMAADGILWM